MIFYIFKVAILSIFIILLTHHIIHYSTTILTPTKIKDYVNVPEKHYKNITELVKSQSRPITTSSIVSTNIIDIPSSTLHSSSSNISSLPSSNQVHCPTEEELMIELSEYMDTIL
jgi:hypothetical protein